MATLIWIAPPGTEPFINLLANGDFSDGASWVPGYGSEAVADNTYSLTGDGSFHTALVRQEVSGGQAGDVIWTRTKVRVTNSDCFNITLNINSLSQVAYTLSNPVMNEWYTIYGSFILTEEMTDFRIYQTYADISSAIFSALQTKTAMINSIGSACYDESLMDVVIKGLTLSNLITNGDFSNGTTGWTGITAIVSGRASKLATSQYASMNQTVTTIIGHIYYFKAYVEGTTNNYFGWAGSGKFLPVNGVQMISRNYTAGATSMLFVGGDARASGWTTFYMDDYMVIDLTAKFGAGNEPTAAQMDALLPNWFDGTAHVVNPVMVNVGKNLCPTQEVAWEQGSLSSIGLPVASTVRIRTIDYIRINPGSTYARSYSGAPYIASIRSYGSDLSFKRNISTSATFTMATDEQYVKIVFLLDDIMTVIPADILTILPQLELGSTATAYEPYKSNSFALTATLRSVFDTATLYRDRLYKLNGSWKIDRYVNPSTGALQTMATEDAVISGTPKSYKNGTFYYNTTVIAPQTEYIYAETDIPTQDGKTMEVQECMFINLTDKFGDNIPTATQINTRIPDWFDGSKVIGEMVVAYDSVNTTKSTTDRSGSFSIGLPAFDNSIIDTYPVGSDVQIWQDDSKFRGWVIRPPKALNGILRSVSLEGASYTARTQKIVVTKSYLNMIISDIVLDLFASYTTFTTVKVEACSKVISIAFADNYLWDCMEQLCKISGNEWYVDEDLDVNFFDKTTQVNTTVLSQANQNYHKGSAKFTPNADGLVNKLWVKGGKDISEPYTQAITVGSIPIHLDYTPRAPVGGTIVVTIGGAAKTLGIQNITEAGTKDFLLNVAEKLLVPDLCTTGTGTIVYCYAYPIKLLLEDKYSQATYGTFEGILKVDTDDKTIAREMGILHLVKYSIPVMTGSIKPMNGLYNAGELIKIEIPDLLIDGFYQIKQVQINSVPKQPIDISLQLETPERDVSSILKDLNDRMTKLENSLDKDSGTEVTVEQYQAFSDSTTVPTITDSMTYDLHQYNLCGAAVLCSESLFL